MTFLPPPKNQSKSSFNEAPGNPLSCLHEFSRTHTTVMFNRNRGRRVYHKTKESYQQNHFNRGRVSKFNETTPREDCFEENVYETDNILLGNIGPMRPESFPRFPPINKVMYLGISSESTFKTAISALALKPEFDAWLNQKKTQIQ